MGEYVTLDRKFLPSILVTWRIRDFGQNVFNAFLVNGRIHDIGQNVLQYFLVNGRIRDIGQNVLRSPIGNCVST